MTKSSALPIEITPRDLAQRLAAGDRLLLIDVREPWEHQICRIEGARLIPMGSVPVHLQSIGNGDHVVCYCHHGKRSLDVVCWLRQQGVETAQSLAGGIERWSAEIDPKVPRY
jgi:rhodanese-related sulfurtransferase